MKRLNLTHAILVSEKTADVDFAKEVARLAGIEFVCYAMGEAVIKHLANFQRQDQCLLFVDVSSNEHLIDFSRYCSASIGPKMIHPNQVSLLVDAPLDFPFQQALSRNRNYGSLIFRQNSPMIEAAQYYCDILKVLSEDKTTVGVDQFILEGADQKSELLGQINRLLSEKTKLQDRMIRTVISAVDELLINAFLDAREDSAAQGHKHLQGRGVVEVCVRRGMGNVSITVVDYQGAFDRFKALGKILPGKGPQTAEGLNVNTVGSRAGIGLALTLNMGASLSIVTHPQIRTEVTVSYKEAANYRDFKKQFQTLSIHC